MYSLSQVLFFVCFFVFLLLLLIFGETTIGIPLLGIIVLLCFVFFPKISFEKKQFALFPVAILGMFSLISLLLIPFSQSVPLSVNNAAFFCGSFVVFFFFVYRDLKWLPNQLILSGLIILATSFSLLNLFYILFSDLSAKLPSLTLLSAQHGHNQIVLLFVLTIPIVWYFAERYKTRWLFFCLTVISIGLLSSFSRVGICIGLIELCILWWTSKNKNLKKIGLLGAGIFGVAVLLSAVLSFNPQFSQESCPVPVFKTQLCKSFHAELRPAYWIQGIEAFSQKPLLGWGGGTFSILSPIFQRKSGDFSGFVHNEYLQAVVEYGLVGGVVFLSFFGCLLWKGIQDIKSKDRFSFVLALGSISVLLISFFDFALHLIGLWIVFLIFVSCWLNESPVHLVHIPLKKAKTLQNVLKVGFFGGAILVFIWSALFICSTILWQLGKIDLAMYTFPFTYGKVRDVLRKGNISNDTQKFLLSLYQNHYQMLDAAAERSGLSSTEKSELLKQAIPLDPLNQSRKYFYIIAVYDTQDWQKFSRVSQEWATDFENGNLESLSFEEYKTVVGMMIDAANKTVTNDLETAFSLYKTVNTLQPWQLATTPIALFDHLDQLPAQQTSVFVQELDQESLWPYEVKIYQWRQRLFIESLDRADFNSAKLYLKGIVEGDPNRFWEVAHLMEKRIQQENDYSKLKEYQELIEIWNTNKQFPGAFNYFVKRELEEKLAKNEK